MKSRDITYVTGAWGAMFKDMAAAYPELVKEFSRDRETLDHQIKHRGFGFLTLDLPLLDDLLLQGLEEGVLPECFHLFGRSAKARVPRLFQGLWLRVFDKSGCLLVDADETSIFFLRQLALMWKKLERPCSLKRLRKSVNEYESIELDMEPPTLQWGEPDPSFLDRSKLDSLSFTDYDLSDSGVDPVSGFEPEQSLSRDTEFAISRSDLKALDAVSRRFCNKLPYYDPYLLANRRERGIVRTAELSATESAFRHGPGAVADLAGDREYPDKYSFPTWGSRLSEIFPFFPFGATSLHRIMEIPPDVNVPSNLIAVPKTQKSPRLIASEPAANQWCQQNIADFFYRTTAFFRSIVDTKDQEVSRSMVKRSSQCRSFATIDLSSASDRLSCKVVERIFASRPDILSALNAVRTSHVCNGIRGTRPFLIKTRKYASQGTACTFPIQSIVFALIAIAGCGYSFEEASGRVRVFGDDIIVPRKKVRKVINLLHKLGLRVNPTKSFYKGFFRESCGMDAYKGIDVTPCKFERLPNASKPTTMLAQFDYANNLHKKGLWHLAEYTGMRCYFSRKRQVSNGRSDNSSVYSFAGNDCSRLQSRYNSDLQRKEVRVAMLINMSKPAERRSLSRLMLNQHSNFGESFSPHIAGRPKLEIAWQWEAANS